LSAVMLISTKSKVNCLVCLIPFRRRSFELNRARFWVKHHICGRHRIFRGQESILATQDRFRVNGACVTNCEGGNADSRYVRTFLSSSRLRS
jgi:hypothetical protein